VQEAIGKFRDEGFRQKIVENAYDYVMNGHTYDHRVRYLMSVIS
jgi:spore maturation protein CgeB